MDPLDLIIEQSHQSETEEIEHWCPVCDRLILPSRKLVGPVPSSSRPSATLASDNETKVSSPFTNEAPTPTTSTSAQRSTSTSTPVLRRKSAQGNVRGGRPMLHRSRTSMLNATTGLHHKRQKPDHNRSNPNFLQDFLVLTHGAGAAPRTKTSPIENTSHLVNIKVEEDPPREPEHVLRTSDRPADMAQMKRKPSVCYFESLQSCFF